MKVSALVGERFKEKPADCQIESHSLMVRGGYIKYVANGIYSLLPPAMRIAKKIEEIFRQEMDAIDGQEVLFPVTMPASLWRESGRYESIGAEMARWKDRSGADMVLGMTHEEAAVQIAREYGASYSRYPFMIYQIQTKFRDEPRARGGLIRVREFTMKDAYSFHTSMEDMQAYYDVVYKAYERIFARCGVPEVISVSADSGMMGGKISHEFMLLTDIGEDSLVLCNHCDYRSNMEVADCILPKNVYTKDDAPLCDVETPHMQTIEAVGHFLGVPSTQTCKAVVYQKNLTDEYVLVFVRGDLEINETKLRNVVQSEIHPAAEIGPGAGLVAGFIGPVNLKCNAEVYIDQSLCGGSGLVCGANKENYHVQHFDVARDLGDVAFVDVAKAYEGSICPKCGQPTIRLQRGVEVGNIFQLGTKYTEPMNMTFQDTDGSLKTPIMASYGIGVGRLMASICEVRRDKYGPIWPMSIAPWQVQICALRSETPEVKTAADELYAALQAMGLEVLYDDRAVSAGVMFSDADLLGVPVRVVLSPKTLARGMAELSARDKSFKEDIPLQEAAQLVQAKVRALQEA